MYEKVNRETAISEFQAWLDAKKVSKTKRESLIEMEEEIIDAIMEGYLQINEDKTITQRLKFPLQTAPETTEIKFAFRINIGVLNIKLKGIKSDDSSGRITAYLTALTEQSKAIIMALDTVDYTIASSIAVYFF